MRLTPRSDLRHDGPVVVHTRLSRCETCGGAELYRIARSIDAEWVDLALCRHCHADNELVVAIDHLTDAALSE